MTIPCTNQDLERRVIATIWSEPSFSIANSVEKDLFVCGIHPHLYEAITECDRHSETSMDSLTHYLVAMGLNRDEVAISLEQLGSTFPDAKSSSVSRLRSLKRMREIRELSRKVMQYTDAGKYQDVDKLLPEFSKMGDMSSRFVHMTDAQSMQVAYKALVEGNRIGYKFGNSEMQSETGGIFAGDLMIIGGLTGVGKTQMSQWIAKGMIKANPGLRPLWLQLEDGPTVIGAREFAFRYGISINNTWAKDRAEDVRLAKDTMDIVYMRGSNYSDIESQIRIHGKKCNLLLIDYLQATDHGIGKSRFDLLIGQNLNKIKDIAGSFDMPVIINSQMNTARQNSRTGIDPYKKPYMHHLSEGSRIEQSTEIGLLLWEESQDSDKTLAYFGKIKYGYRRRNLEFEVIKNSVEDGGMISGLREYIPEIEEQTNFRRR